MLALIGFQLLIAALLIWQGFRLLFFTAQENELRAEQAERLYKKTGFPAFRNGAGFRGRYQYYISKIGGVIFLVVSIGMLISMIV